MLWAAALGPRARDYGPAVDAIADHFDFDAPDIDAVCAELAVGPPDPAGLWRACRARARAGLDGLAEPIVTRAGWDDLVLPDPLRETLRDVTRQARHRHLVYHEWGMATRAGSGLGVTALFTGDSGTGKTLAAEVLAGDLGLDLYRVDLSAVVSKYIGETEKNLKRVFDAAQASGAVLLFDEADALFGRRSEVKDSHDRYANVEVAYLLQRMESYRGVAILTTNLKAALDRSFLRRIRFVVNFPFPDPAARAKIWRLMLPPTLPTDGVDVTRLARLQVSGGNIRTIALGAAFLAAENGGVVTHEHLLTATRREYHKLEKPLTDTEMGGRP
jgi:SpoVK/Ycf46/Vps4 family AAA+-type ATPase